MELGLYIHWPFCLSICPYCDFNRTVIQDIDQLEWKKAYTTEMRLWRALTGPRTLKSIFFGGGTPSLMCPSVVACVIEESVRLWSATPDLEVTLEMNPTSIEMTKMSHFLKAGVNRASVGVQSLRSSTLKFLGRQHTPTEAIQALIGIKDLFPRFSFDLIYAHRDHTCVSLWEEELTQALSYAGDHLSLYQLTYEQGTPFEKQRQKGLNTPLNEELCAQLYDFTQHFMAAQGWQAYEVSNYARNRDHCRHNMLYWNGQDFIGIGPGAHGRLTLAEKRFSTANPKAFTTWLSMMNKEQLTKTVLVENPLEEMLLMGLRLKEGVPYRQMGTVSDVLRKRISLLTNEGFIEKERRYLRLSEKGRLCLDSVLTYLLA